MRVQLDKIAFWIQCNCEQQADIPAKAPIVQIGL